MEIKATLKKPYSEERRMDFIVQCNHKLGYEIKETKDALEAWGYTQEEIEQKEKERIGLLSLTRGDVFRALLLAKGVTRNQIRALIENDEQISDVQRELALIDFDEALNFYRGNELITELGAVLGITSEQLDKFFETNDYTCLIDSSAKPQNDEGEDDPQENQAESEDEPIDDPSLTQEESFNLDENN